MNLIFGYPGYWATEDGKVWSSPRPRTRGGFLKTSPDGSGYPMVSLSREGKSVSRTVHGLVARAFLGNPPPGMEVRHLDGNPENNDVRNLKYGTKSENRADSVAHGTHRNARKTHCKNGHEFTPENIYRCSDSPNARRCRTCTLDRQRVAK